MVSEEEKNLAMVCHLAPLIGYTIGIGQILVPLIIYLWKREESDYVRAQAAESLNFQISATIYIIISVILMFVLIGFVTLAVVGIVTLVTMIQATIKASKGEYYQYPFCIRFVS